LLDAERDTAGRKQKKQIDEALEWLPLALARGARPARELFREAEELGIGSTSLRRAKDKLNVISSQWKDGWWWTLPMEEKAIPAEAV
jgi:hypothetical protein